MKLFLRVKVESGKISGQGLSDSSPVMKSALTAALIFLAGATPLFAAETEPPRINPCDSAFKTNLSLGLPILATSEPMAPLSPMAKRIDTDSLVRDLQPLEVEGDPQFLERQNDLGRVELQLVARNQELALLRLILGSNLNGEVTYQWRVGKSPVLRKHGVDYIMEAAQIRKLLAHSKEEFLQFIHEARVTDFILDREDSRKLWRLSSAANGGSRQYENPQISEMHTSEFTRWILELYKQSQASP